MPFVCPLLLSLSIRDPLLLFFYNKSCSENEWWSLCNLSAPPLYTKHDVLWKNSSTGVSGIAAVAEQSSTSCLLHYGQGVVQWSTKGDAGGGPVAY